MYIDQKNDRDCLQATLANLLSIEYSSIPLFYLDYEKDNDCDGSDFSTMFDPWLNSIGFYRTLFDISFREDGTIALPFYCGVAELLCIGILKKKIRWYSHAVLLKMSKIKGEEFSIEIVHDPKTNSDYVLSDLIQVELINKIDDRLFHLKRRT